MITVGVGKSHLACALGHIAVRRRRTVLMARADKLFKRLKAARLDNSLDAEMRKLTGIELLIIDDLASSTTSPCSGSTRSRPATSTSCASNGTRKQPP